MSGSLCDISSRFSVTVPSIMPLGIDSTIAFSNSSGCCFRNRNYFSNSFVNSISNSFAKFLSSSNWEFVDIQKIAWKNGQTIFQKKYVEWIVNRIPKIIVCGISRWMAQWISKAITVNVWYEILEELKTSNRRNFHRNFHWNLRRNCRKSLQKSSWINLTEAQK